jgi:hypothetical protein
VTVAADPLPNMLTSEKPCPERADPNGKCPSGDHVNLLHLRHTSTMSETPDEPLMTDTEVAEPLQVVPGTPSGWRSRCVGPPYFKFGNLIRYRRSEVLEWRSSGSSLNSCP